ELNRIEEAEKSGLQAERLDVRPRFPQLHLLLAAIFARKNNYAGAIDQLQMYLNLVPQGTNSDLAREHLAQMEKLKSIGPGEERAELKIAAATLHGRGDPHAERLLRLAACPSRRYVPSARERSLCRLLYLTGLMRVQSSESASLQELFPVRLKWSWRTVCCW